MIASFFTILFYAWQGSHINLSWTPSSSLWLALPYLILTILALCRLHVLIVLSLAIFSCFLLGLIYGHYTPLMFAQDLFRGFASMQEIILLTMLIGGLSELTLQGQQWLGEAFFNPYRLSTYKKHLPFKIASLALFYDLLLANNTIAILLTSKISKPIADQEKLSPAIHATILDVYTSVAQGLLPYGAQILLAASLASLPPILIIPHVLYCLILGIVTTIWIGLAHKKFFL
jgi:Na+/H+ antiporter NhaC